MKISFPEKKIVYFGDIVIEHDVSEEDFNKLMQAVDKSTVGQTWVHLTLYCPKGGSIRFKNFTVTLD